MFCFASHKTKLHKLQKQLNRWRFPRYLLSVSIFWCQSCQNPKEFSTTVQTVKSSRKLAKWAKSWSISKYPVRRKIGGCAGDVTPVCGDGNPHKWFDPRTFRRHVYFFIYDSANRKRCRFYFEKSENTISDVFSRMPSSPFRLLINKVEQNSCVSRNLSLPVGQRWFTRVFTFAAFLILVFWGRDAERHHLTLATWRSCDASRTICSREFMAREIILHDWSFGVICCDNKTCLNRHKGDTDEEVHLTHDHVTEIHLSRHDYLVVLWHSLSFLSHSNKMVQRSTPHNREKNWRIQHHLCILLLNTYSNFFIQIIWKRTG